MVMISSGIGSGYWWSSSAALRPVEKWAHNQIRLLAFLTSTMDAAHWICYWCDDLHFPPGVLVPCPPGAVPHTAGTSCLGEKTSFVEGLSASVDLAWVQRPKLLVKTGERRFSIFSVWSIMVLWVEDLDTALQIKLSRMSRIPSDSIKSSP